MAIFRLKQIRLTNGMSQKELAEKSGVSQNLIARLESGELKNTSLATLKKLATALECDVNEIFLFE